MLVNSLTEVSESLLCALGDAALHHHHPQLSGVKVKPCNKQLQPHMELKCIYIEISSKTTGEQVEKNGYVDGFLERLLVPL